jgi:nucleoside-diphosphate-sugar epimerase
MGVERIILGSTLDLYADLWAKYRIDEGWRTRPRPHIDQLCAYLAEVTLREVTRVTGVPAICLRYGRVVDEGEVQSDALSGQPPDPRWIHVDDAVSATLRATSVEATGWHVYHISAAGDKAAVPNAHSVQAPFSYAPVHTFLEVDEPFPAFSDPLPEPLPRRPIRRVVIFGAGGPLGAAVAENLKASYQLRLADIRPVEEAAAAKPQSPGAPLPTPPLPPHEWLVMDVRDADQVMAACEGMDAIINCSVLRSDPIDAFRVNTLGAYHVMRAAVQNRISRVVHTGPFLVAQEGPSGFRWDDWIVDDVPARPGTSWVYNPTKLLGKEICRIYAQYYGLEVPALAFVHFRNPATSGRTPDSPPGWRLNPFSVSWTDAALAVRAALEVRKLPSPFEYMHIGAELPHGVYPMDKAKRILGWEAKDYFEECYARGQT